MGAATVPLEIDQGEDWTATIVYTDDLDQPYYVIPPCRLDIKSNQGAMQLSLTTPVEDLPDGVIPDIALSPDSGLIQIHIPAGVTANMVPSQYQYDLFVTVNDHNEYAGNQIQRLIQGTVTVSKRVTKL